MARQTEVDVVVIGTGAAGGTAAYVLASKGLNVLAIEAGPRLSNKDFVKRLDEVGEGCVTRNSLGGPKFNREIPTWRPNKHSPIQPTLPIGMANAVGGSTLHFGACYWRFLEDDFRMRSSTIARYGKGALPAGTSITDWPITYADLEPFYDEVEFKVGVSGKGGSNPFEAPRARGYPMPPLRPSGYPTMIAQAMNSLGYHSFPQPAAILSESYRGRVACTYCGFCGDGFGCWNNSKSSTLVTLIAEAEKTGRLKIRTNSRVMAILSDSKGRVTGVKYREPSGKMVDQPAKFVILGGYVFENSRMLLLSKSGAYPHGLSNNHGQVGKYYRAQVNTSVSGLFPGKDLNLWQGSSGQSFAMDDLNGDNFDHHGLGFIRGANISAGTNNLPVSQSVNVAPGVPLYGSEYKQWIHTNAQSVGGLLGQMETLPYEANFIDLDPVKKDDLGVPVARVTFNAYENEKRMGAFLTEKMSAILTAAGASMTWGGLGIVPLYSHAYGGTRMGEDPAASVVDRHSISHEARNLAIMGGSTFVSVAGYNPTETMQALAWFGADYIGENFGSLAG